MCDFVAGFAVGWLLLARTSFSPLLLDNSDCESCISLDNSQKERHGVCEIHARAILCCDSSERRVTASGFSIASLSRRDSCALPVYICSSFSYSSACSSASGDSFLYWQCTWITCDTNKKPTLKLFLSDRSSNYRQINPRNMHFAEPAIRPSSIRTEDPTCANHVDVLTVWSVFSFKCPYQHPPWSPVSIGKPAPKIHQWTIYFCRWGFGWVDKAQCFRSARRFGAAGSSPDFSRGFSRHGAPRPLSWTFFQCTLLSYPGQPSYSHAFRWASDPAKFYQDWGPDLCESRWRAHSLIGVFLRMSISTSSVVSRVDWKACA